MPDVPCLQPDQFANFLLTELPIYVPTILRDVRPTDGLLGHISTGTWDAYKGTSMTQDRFLNVKANVSKRWLDVEDTACLAGNNAPCDIEENEICWGWSRMTFGQKKQSWKSQMLCFDQILSVTEAVEHTEQIVSEILRPATSDVTSFFVRKEALRLSGNKLLANATMSPFTFTWNPVGNEEIFATPSAFPTSKLTPEMIQRQLPRMRGMGYFGKWTNDPFWGGYDQFAELLTDDDTVWDMDKLATNSKIGDAWRFTEWNAAHEYMKYGMGGQIGNYMTHVDPFCLRFNKKGSQLQLVLPYTNTNPDATAGIGSIWNNDYDNAQYQISFIWHRFAWKLLVKQMQALNPLMPFAVRDLSGQWRFAIDNLGGDCSGKPIANYRKNKGFFYADWRLAAQPFHTEWMTAILHLREPKVIYVVAPCAADPGYPEQNYNSACDPCNTTYTWTPDPGYAGHYIIAANTVTCGDEPLANGAINAATLAALVTALTNDAALGLLGTWSTTGGQLILTDATCEPILPWVTS